MDVDPHISQPKYGVYIYIYIIVSLFYHGLVDGDPYDP